MPVNKARACVTLHILPLKRKLNPLAGRGCESVSVVPVAAYSGSLPLSCRLQFNTHILRQAKGKKPRLTLVVTVYKDSSLV